MIGRKLNAHNVLGPILSSALFIGAAPMLGINSVNSQMIQFSMGSQVGESDEQISQRDVDSLVEVLKLDADQEALVRALYEGHRSAWQSASADHRSRVQAAFESSRESKDWSQIPRKTSELQKQWQATGDAMELDFLNGVRGIASPEQMAGWPRFEQDRRRRSLLRSQSVLSGEGVDLVDVSESIDLTSEELTQVQPVSNVYREEIDMAIADRSRSLGALEKASLPATEGDFGSIDFEAVKEAQGRVHEKRIAVRDLNARYAALFCGQLSADDAQEFMTVYKQRSFPRVYRPTAADQYVKTVESLGTLNEDQTRALESIVIDYRRQLGAINDQLAEIIRKEEDEKETSDMFFAGGGLDHLPPPPLPPSNGDGEDAEQTAVGVFMIATPDGQGGGGGLAGQMIEGPIHTSFAFPSAEPEDDSPRGRLNKSKRELVNRTIEAVAALLTPEQLALAPKPDQMQQLSSEERMRRQVEKALESAVIETSGEDGHEITITFEPSSEESKP